jgi:hypothetical protein
VRGDLVYLSQGYGGAPIVEVSNPAHPIVRGHARLPQGVSDFAFARRRDGLCRRGRGGPAPAGSGRPCPAILAGQPPSRETLGYLKRRARRLLRTIAKRDPAAYADLACRTLVESGRGSDTLDPRHQWASVDVLFGGGQRYLQQSHGRGPYVPRRDFRPAAAPAKSALPMPGTPGPTCSCRLLETPDLFWQAHEFALKALARAKAIRRAPNCPMPRLTAAFSASDSPLLVQRRHSSAVAKQVEQGGKTVASTGPRRRLLFRQRACPPHSPCAPPYADCLNGRTKTARAFAERPVGSAPANH